MFVQPMVGACHLATYKGRSELFLSSIQFIVSLLFPKDSRVILEYGTMRVRTNRVAALRVTESRRAIGAPLLLIVPTLLFFSLPTMPVSPSGQIEQLPAQWRHDQVLHNNKHSVITHGPFVSQPWIDWSKGLSGFIVP